MLDMAYLLTSRHGRPGSIFSNSIKLMLERHKSTLYQQDMLLEREKITPY